MSIGAVAAAAAALMKPSKITVRGKDDINKNGPQKMSLRLTPKRKRFVDEESPVNSLTPGRNMKMAITKRNTTQSSPRSSGKKKKMKSANSPKKSGHMKSNRNNNNGKKPSNQAFLKTKAFKKPSVMKNAKKLRDLLEKAEEDFVISSDLDEIEEKVMDCSVLNEGISMYALARAWFKQGDEPTQAPLEPEEVIHIKREHIDAVSDVLEYDEEGRLKDVHWLPAPKPLPPGMYSMRIPQREDYRVSEVDLSYEGKELPTKEQLLYRNMLRWKGAKYEAKTALERNAHRYGFSMEMFKKIAQEGPLNPFFLFNNGNGDGIGGVDDDGMGVDDDGIGIDDDGIGVDDDGMGVDDDGIGGHDDDMELDREGSLGGSPNGHLGDVSIGNSDYVNRNPGGSDVDDLLETKHRDLDQKLEK